MLRKVLQTLNRAIKAVKMADILPSSTITVQDGIGTKRTAEDEDLSSQKKQKTESNERLGRKKKVAMLIGFNGKGYYGLQINKGFKTIEDDILKALVETECVPQEHADTPQKMSFQRACRTDKGVSAARNILSLKMIIDKENLVEELNSKLPDQIRVFGIKRTTKGFDSKNFCDNRTYIYICPTYAFAPMETIVTDAYRITDDVVDRINELLKKFIGTHKFHNYTSKIKGTERRAKRYMISFNCGKPFIRDGCEFCILSVKGQSFMMHQIRKMIGITISIVRGNCGEDVIDKSWENDRVDIPKAPGLGLCLDEPHYNGYNKRFGNDGIHEPLEWSEFQEEIDKFKEDYIYSDIIKTEKEEKVMLAWLGTLQFHEFDVCNDLEARERGWRQSRFMEKCRKNPDIVITPDSKPAMRQKQKSDEDSQGSTSEIEDSELENPDDGTNKRDNSVVDVEPINQTVEGTSGEIDRNKQYEEEKAMKMHS